MSALNNGGAITGMDVREDGVYITYVPSDGADAVSKKLGEPSIPILLQCAIGAEWSTHSHTYICPSDGYYLVGAGGRVMTGCYVTKNNVSQTVNQIGTGDFRSYNCIVKCVKGDTVSSSVSGQGGMGTMVKIIFFAPF